MIRAAAKNYQDVLVVVDSADYGNILQLLKGGGVGSKTRLKLAGKAFRTTAAYDALVASYLNGVNGETFPDKLTLTYDKVQDMRYGENPHQSAAFYQEPFFAEGSLAAAEQLNGKELSYNNIGDASSALAVLREFDNIAAVGLKHMNPCGVAEGKSVLEAYKKAYAADPTSIYGGIVALNECVDEATAKELASIFLEIVIAPDYTKEAREILCKKKNLRVLRLPSIRRAKKDAMEVKSVPGGLLIQQADTTLLEGELQVVTKRRPSGKEMEDHSMPPSIALTFRSSPTFSCPWKSRRFPWAAPWRPTPSGAARWERFA